MQGIFYSILRDCLFHSSFNDEAIFIPYIKTDPITLFSMYRNYSRTMLIHNVLSNFISACIIQIEIESDKTKLF